MSVLAPLDFSSVKRLTNLNDINRALHETVALERSIEAELEQLLSKRADIEKGFITLHDSASDVSIAVITKPGLLIDAHGCRQCLPSLMSKGISP